MAILLLHSWKRFGCRSGGVDLKDCSHCGRTLPVSEFYKNKARKDGYQSECKECTDFFRKRVLSYDRRMMGKKTYLDVHVTLHTRVDETYERVFKTLGEWIGDGTLTEQQAEAIYLHDIELFSFGEIAKFVDVNRSTVSYHHKNGIERLRERYCIEEWTVAMAA